MPNWVNNTIICKENLVNKIMNGDGDVDFGILIPEPETKEELIANYGKDYLDTVDENGRSARSLDHSDGKEWFNWYDWHCNFWGTKWNACDSNKYTQDGYVYIEFATAWSPPQQWIEKLAALGIPFILHWEEEQGFGGYEGYNGAIEIEGEFNIPEYDEDGDPIINDEEERELPSKEKLKKFFGD